jgi:hypothetical protein
MSGLTEQEIIDRHVLALKDASEACRILHSNADPERATLRGPLYRKLKNALTALEGSCRQMAAFRSDTRWTKLGFVYARAMRAAQANMTAHNWLAFGELRKLFENGLVSMTDLKDRKTGKTGTILPQRTDWLILPDHKPYRTPRRMLN